MLDRSHCDGMRDCQADFHHDGCGAECSACGHQQREHKWGTYKCECDILGLSGEWRQCTCTFVRKMNGRDLALSQIQGLYRGQASVSASTVGGDDGHR